MDVAATQHLLGVRPELGGLRIDPCVPAEWEGFVVRRRYRGCSLSIDVKNPRGVEKGVRSISVDGREVDLSRGPICPAELLGGRASAEIVVVMGGG
jgi:cellobiose phosphorylase